MKTESKNMTLLNNIPALIAFSVFAVFAITATFIKARATDNTAKVDDAAAVQKIEDSGSKEPRAKTAWSTEVQKKYALSNEQMKSLEKAGLHGPQLAFAAEAAKASGKSIDEVIQMRIGDKMGWGKIAKKLGLPRGSLGHSVSTLRHDVKKHRDEKKAEKAAVRVERKAKRDSTKEAHKTH